MAPGARRTFGRTWWGQAWVRALEGRAQLDPNRLPRGRTYARGGRVGPLDVDRGEVRAAVHGSRARPYSVRVRVRPFTSAEWDVVFSAVAARAAHAAALLDGELEPGVVDDIAAAGISLLPGPGEVGPRCSCPDWADPCKHSAAVCYLVAEVLDSDPFALLLLRGRSRAEVLAGLRRVRATSAPEVGRPVVREEAGADPGIEARVAWGPGVGGVPGGAGEAGGGPHGASVEVPPPPTRPGHPTVLAVDPPAGSGVTTNDLAALASDAARRAWELCTGDGDGGLGLSVEADLARRAASLLGRPDFAALAGRSGVRAPELVRLASAWRAGGVAGVEVLGPARSAALAQAMPGDVVEEARATFGAGVRVTVQGNRVTGADVQLRFGSDGRWYRFDRIGGRWEMQGLPNPDPARLADGA